MNYQSATHLRVFLFSLGTVFAKTPEEAERVASENGLWNKRPDGTWGNEASEAHAQLCRDTMDAYRNRATRYSATIQFADGGTRCNGIATEDQLTAWLERYGVTADVASGTVTGLGPAAQVIIERFEI